MSFLKNLRPLPIKKSLSKGTGNFARARAAAAGAARASALGLGAVAAAGAIGASKIRKASKALNKSIGSIHSKQSMDVHQKMLDANKSKRAAAGKLRRSLLKKIKPIKKALTKQPGSPKTPGYDPSKWR